MPEKSIYLCVQKDILPSLKWILEDYQNRVQIRMINSPEKVTGAVDGRGSNVLILDADDLGKPLLELLNELHREEKNTNTILIIPPTASREDIMEIIKASLVKGIVVRPFTAEVVSKYIDKILGLEAVQ
ncbi:MAG: hypothetical protein WA610_16135 [Thermodesulfovibrionales bacterium]